MNLKKFAVRGIVILAIFVALCMFFSGTIRTITTPKVQLTSGKRGKLEERIQLSCKLVFPSVEKVEVELPEETTLTILAVNTREGYTVSEGDVVVRAKVSNYEQLRKQYQDAYDQASEQLLNLENKNRGIRISKRDQAYADAYFGLRDARRDEVARALGMDALLSKEGLPRVESGYPDAASADLRRAIDAWRSAAAAKAEAEQAMDAASRYTVDDATWTYITEKRDYQQKIDEAEASLGELIELNDRVQNFYAPHDGYIAEVFAKEGESFDGSQPLYTLTPEGTLPSLRADISEVERSVTEGMTATLNPDSYDAIDTQVVATGTDAEGRKYVDIALNDLLVRARGSVLAMMQEETPISLIYRSRDSSTLLPTTAVRGSGEDRYVFTVEQNTAAFGGNTLRLHKMSVKVIGEYGGTTAVQEDLTYYTIAYGEDRAIDDGDVVMEYIK